MRATDLRVCPECGTQNKAKWEFCVRCGESLQDVPLGTGDASSQEDVTPGEGPGMPRGQVLLVAALALALIAAWKGWLPHSPEAQRIDPALFAGPTVPSPAPTPPVSLAAPGQKEFEEGRRLLTSGQVARAIELLARAVELDGGNPLYHNTYGVALSAGSQEAAASREFEAAVQLSPVNLAYVMDWARSLDRAGDLERAQGLYQRVLAVRPTDDGALRGLAGIGARSQRFDVALPALRRLAEMHADDLVLQQDLGYALARTGDLAAAVAAYQKVLDLRPSADYTRGLMAEALLKQGRGDEAVALLKNRLTQAPNAPLVHRGLGSLLERTGRPEQAVAEYRAYARLVPNAPDAAQLADRAARLEKAFGSS
jgi:Flp pilus assembly protein TadD